MKEDVIIKLEEILKNYNINMETIDKDRSIIEANIIDSITFVNMLLEIEDTLGVLINFDEVDMEQLVYLNNLIDHIKSIS